MVVLTAETRRIERIQGKVSKGTGTWATRGDQVQLPVPSQGSHGHVDALQKQRPGFLRRAGHTGTLCLAQTRIPNSQRKAGVQAVGRVWSQ